jgi:hypothetical protein
MKPLQTNTTYVHTGNAFSRAFFVRDNFTDKKRCIVFENDAELKYFRKIFMAISNNKAVTIEKLEDITSLIFSTG